MTSIPQLNELTTDEIIVAEGSRFLKELNKEKPVKSLAPHTCEAVNAEQHPTFKVRISQTKKGGKVVVSFTCGTHTICFMVKTSHKFTYNAEKMITAVKDAATRCGQEVIDLCKHRKPALEPVYYSKGARRKACREHFDLRPELSRKPEFRAVAAS